APRIFYRAITARSVLGLGAIYSVANADFARAPFLTVGHLAGPSNAEIDHLPSGLLGENPPPALTIRSDANTHFEIELATGANLLLPANAAARNAANYFNTGAGGLGVPAVPLTAINAVGVAVVPDVVWTTLGADRFLYYRVTTFQVGPAGRFNVAQSPVNNAHRMPGLWGGLPIDST